MRATPLPPPASRAAAGLPALLLAMLLGACVCAAQPRDLGFGVDLSPALVVQRADFTALPGVPNCCPAFTGDADFGFAAGLSASAPLGGRLSGELGLRLLRMGGSLDETEATTFIAAGAPLAGAFEHVLRARLLYLAVEPRLRARLAGGLEVRAGLRLGLPLAASYEQWERIVAPADAGVFMETGTRTRNLQEGDIPDLTPLGVSLLAGIGYRLALDRDAALEAEPAVTWSQGLTRVVSGVDWTLSDASASIALRYHPWRRAADTVAAPPPPPPPPPRVPLLAAELRAYGIDSAGGERAQPSLRIEEFIGAETRPLLPFIFFAEGSAEIPPRYPKLMREQAAEFQPDRIAAAGALESSRQLLNILGRRMQEQPAAAITLVGCNADAGAERRATDLSRRRAEAVRAYLVATWGIAASRIAIKVRNLPVINSPTAEADGLEENRRVEIEPGAPELLRPVTAADTLRLVTRPRLRFRPAVTAEAGVDAWRLEILRGARVLHAFEGRGTVPAVLEWDATAERGPLDLLVAPDARDAHDSPAAFDSLSCALTVRDATGRSVRTPPQEIRVERYTVQRKREERIADRVIDRYALLLFDFNQSGIRSVSRPVLDIIRARIGAGSTVRITGYTDRIGDAQRNRELSAARALEVRRALGVDAATEGVGEDAMRYDNATPEGRMYCRTVVVTVETPVDYGGGGR